MDHANPLPPSLTVKSIQKRRRSSFIGYAFALVAPFIVTVCVLYVYARYSNHFLTKQFLTSGSKVVKSDDGTFGLSAIGSEDEYKNILIHLTPTPQIVADNEASLEARMETAPHDPFAPAIIDLQKSPLPTPAKFLADGSTLYASQNGKTYVLTTTSGRDPKQASIIPEGGTLLSSPDGLFILSAEAPGSSRLSAYQTNTHTKPTKLWTLATSQTSRIGFSTLYKGELVLGISSSLATNLPCAMTVATIDDKPVEVNCAATLSPTAPFVPSSMMTLLKIQPISGLVTNSFSSFMRKNIDESVFRGFDSLYLTYPLSSRTGIAQISLADLSLTDSLQVPGTLTKYGALHEFDSGKILVVSDSEVPTNWHLTAPYPGTSSVIPKGSFRKTVSRQSMYAIKSHLYIPPTKHGEAYQITDMSNSPNISSIERFITDVSNSKFYGLDGGVVLMAEMFFDKSNLSLVNMAELTSPARLATTSFEKVLLRSGYIPNGIVVNSNRHQFFLAGRDAGYFFTYTSSGSVKLEKTLTNHTFDLVISEGNKMYFYSDKSIDFINLDTFKMNLVLAFE